MAATSPTIASVEGARSKKGPKMLAHMEIHPGLKGGHMVRHVYAGYKHEADEHQFKQGEEARMTAHIHRHLGIKPVKAEGSKHENEADIDDEKD